MILGPSITFLSSSSLSQVTQLPMWLYSLNQVVLAGVIASGVLLSIFYAIAGIACLGGKWILLAGCGDTAGKHLRLVVAIPDA